MDIEDVKKPIDTIELAASAIGLIKSLGLIFAMVLVEWARARQRLAENKQAVAESNVAASKKKEQVDEKNRGKSDVDIVDEFLHSRGGDRGSPPGP